MCTAISFTAGDHYFGRNLDLEYSYQETIAIAPRSYPLPFRHMDDMPYHHAMIGVAYMPDGYPLYYDAVNEHGLGMAGLNFPGNAAYFAALEGCDNVASFELIPWILGQCSTVQEARPLLSRLCLTNDAYSPELPPSPLHWMLSDREESVVIEQAQDGLHVYSNPVRVLTNNPPFPWHVTHLNLYMSLTAGTPSNSFAPALTLTHYSRGMGALGLPGDCSSSSRFVRAAYHLHHAACEETETSAVSQFFHILGSVAFPRGSVMLEDGRAEITVYTVCCNVTRGIYYYTTYDNSAITAVDMMQENLDGCELICYPLLHDQRIMLQNRRT